MEARTLKFVAEAVGGQLLRGKSGALVRRVCTDSRQAAAGDLFLAIKGDRFDGHDFLSDVAGKDVGAIVMARDRQLDKIAACPAIVVDEPRVALGKLAAAYRRQFPVPIIAVGGSNGKTTTKELIASVLREKLATLHSDASFNNDIGVPLTLLRLEKIHAAAVLEIGTNHPGELAPLVDMVQPKFGVITSIGREHLEFFRNLAGVAKEEGVLAEALPADGKLFLNGDSEWTAQIARRTRATVVRAGFEKSNHWRASEPRCDAHGLTFCVEGPFAEFCGEFRVALLGRHQAVNALFAIAVGAELGLDAAEIRQGLEACSPPKMRCQLWEHDGVKVLDDCYNANADSVLAALQTLADLPCNGRRVAVLGDMAELGAASKAAHEEVGRRAAELGVDQLLAVGTMASVLGAAARAGGLNRVLEIPEVEPAARALKRLLKAGDLVLLKASRSVRLERLADALRDPEAKPS